jgi:hypothetical protein
VKTYPLPKRNGLWHSAIAVFLRSTNRKKDGKDHRYFSVVENQRVSGDTQQAAWRKTLAVFDEDTQQVRNLSLFPEDRTIPADVWG